MLALRRMFGSHPTVSPTLDPEAATVVHWAIAPNAVDRPATAAVLADHLDGLA
jgi:hypothetical protein